MKTRCELLKELGIDRKNSSALLSGIAMYAIRSEHIARDSDGVEARFRDSLLLADGIIDNFIPATGAERFAFKNSGTVLDNQIDNGTIPESILSKEGRHNLCAALCEEIQAYKRFLYGARNLDVHDVLLSLKELRHSCPDESKNELHLCYREWNGGSESHHSNNLHQEEEGSE